MRSGKQRKWSMFCLMLLMGMILSGCGRTDINYESTERTSAETEAESTEGKSMETEAESAEGTSMETEAESSQGKSSESLPESAEAGTDMTGELTADGNYIIVEKAERTLTLYQADGTVLAQYPVGLAQNPVGAKQQEGDKKTPEGEYYVCVKNKASKFHKALGLSYPNIQDAERGLEAGLITQEQEDSITEAIRAGGKPDWYTALGGEVMIHGQKGDLGSQSDWTTGCIAMDNDAIDAIWDQVEVGTKVTINP